MIFVIAEHKDNKLKPITIGTAGFCAACRP